MKKVAVVTATRAEYGILRPLIFRLREEREICLQVVVTGTHLEEKYGNTQQEIVQDGIDIFRRIPILEKGNTAYDISLTMANAVRGFAEYFRDERPELVIVLGDRTELLGVCCAAMNERVPIAHLHGGELTEGAVDDCVRHAITKMSYLHFPAAEVYRRRIIQMGEAPERVFNVGALGVENILNTPLLSEEEIRRQVGIPTGQKYAVVTFHPVTLEHETAREQVNALIAAMKREREYFYLITKANADAGGALVNELLEKFAEENANVRLVASLGMVRYLSAVKYCEFVLGNSSSGVIEAPALGVPTVNIGDRQKGRLMAETVIPCGNRTEDIVDAIQRAADMQHQVSALYGTGHTSERIVEVIKHFLFSAKIELKKPFYDMEKL
jgi:GDP/UDP-N,N'-diacetylbacillosamine 2-epimerase (hydrolysing)